MNRMFIRTLFCAVLVYSGELRAACDSAAIARIDGVNERNVSRYPTIQISWREGSELATEGEDVAIRISTLGKRKIYFISIELVGHSSRRKTEFVFADNVLRMRADEGGPKYRCAGAKGTLVISKDDREMHLLRYVADRASEKGVNLQLPVHFLSEEPALD